MSAGARGSGIVSVQGGAVYPCPPFDGLGFIDGQKLERISFTPQGHVQVSRTAHDIPPQRETRRLPDLSLVSFVPTPLTA